MMDTRGWTASSSGSNGAGARSRSGSTSKNEDTRKLTNSNCFLKEGYFDKVKFSLGDGKFPKQWKQMYAVLTKSSLFFVENHEESNNILKNNGVGICEFYIKLGGAELSLNIEQNGKKIYVMIISQEGRIVLFQNDEAIKTNEWYQELKKVTLNLDRRPSVKISNCIEEKRLFLTRFLKERPRKETLKEKGIYRNEPVFGNSLQILYETSEDHVPEFVVRCTNLLSEERHVTSIGIYSRSGTLSEIQALRYQVNQNRLQMLETMTETHAMAGALKLFFRELQQPLISYPVYLEICEAVRQHREGTKLLAPVRRALKGLPAAHFETLKLLITHLNLVTQHEEANQMNAANMAIVWGPNIVWPEERTPFEQMFQNSNVVNDITEYLILNYWNIFNFY